jgi:hypothetical protein
MPNSRFPRRGHRLAPTMLRHLLEVPIPAKYLPSGGHCGMLLADLDETAWERFPEATCRELARLVVRTVAGKARTPAFPGNQPLPPLPDGLTLADLNLEIRTQNSLAAAGLHERPQDLRALTLDDLLGLRGFWVKSLVDLLTALEHTINHPEARQKVVVDPGMLRQRLRARRGYPRPGHPLAPRLLKELLLERLPGGLVRGTPYAGLRLCDLDENAWDHLTMRAIGHLAGLIVTRAEMAGHHRAIVPRHLPAPPKGMQLEDLQLDDATRRCLAREGLGTPLERLGKLTVGDLLLLDGFDARCLVDLLTLLETLAGREHQLDQALTAEAQTLRDLPEAPHIHFHDPRLGHVLRAMDTEANTVREMAELVTDRRLDPPEPERVCEQFRQLRQDIQRMRELPLDAELSQIFDPGTGQRDREILAGYFGWDGRGARTAEAVGRKYGLSRERIRQICGMAIRRVRNVRVFAPALDRALALLAERPPMPLANFQAEFDAAGAATCHVPVESLLLAAKFLARKPAFTIVEMGKLRMTARPQDAGLLQAVIAALRRATKKCGLGSLEQIMAELARRRVKGANRAFVRGAIQGLDDFCWLDKRRNWFRTGYSEHFGLAKLARKILSVAGKIRVSLMRSAMLRSRRHERGLPPAGILLEYCRQMPRVRIRGKTIIADPPSDWRKTLAGIERTMVRVLKKHGSPMDRASFEEQCLRRGMNRFTFNAVATNSPVVLPYGRCLYGLVGATVGGRTMARGLARRHPRSTARVLTGHGRTPDGRVFLNYRLSPAVVANGIVTVPAALRRQLRGTFALHNADGCKAGELTARNACAWGLGPALRAQKAAEGDCLLLVFDVAGHTAQMHLGSEAIFGRVKP